VPPSPTAPTKKGQGDGQTDDEGEYGEASEYAKDDTDAE